MQPWRRAILARLARGPATVGELAQPFDVSLPAVSHHLKVLEVAGLIRRERQAQWCRCHLQPGSLTDAAQWIEHHRAFWEARDKHEEGWTGCLACLERYLAEEAV